MERTRRRFWTLAISAGAVLVILAAAASGLFQIAVQSVPGYRADVEKYVRQYAGRPVRIGTLGLTWRYYYPSLDLEDVALLADDGKTPVLQAERLRLGFGLTRLVRGDFTPNRLELVGLGLNAQVDQDGRLTVQGIESNAAPDGGETLEALRPLTRFSRLRLERCRLNLRDQRRGNELYSFGIVSAALDRGLLGDALTVELALPASLGDSARGELLFTGELLDPSSWSGTATGEISNLVLENWLAKALVPGVRVFAPDTELRLRGALERGALQSLGVELRSGPIRAHRAQHAAVIEGLELAGSVRREAGGWSAKLDELLLEGEEGPWPETHAELHATVAEGAPAAYEGTISYLRIADLAPWLQMLAVPPALGALSEVSGDVRNLQVRAQGSGDTLDYSYRASFDALALPASGRAAGFSGLRGEVAGDESGGRSLLQEGALTLEVPGRLSAPEIPLEAFDGELEWRRLDEGWRVAMPQFRFRMWGLRGKGRVAVELPPDPERSPMLDLAAQFSADDVTRAKPLMPQAWGAGLRSWLDRSIVSGRAPRADLVIQGPLADFPYQLRQTGHWSLDIDAARVGLSFHPDWPPINDIGAHLRFEGNSLAIEASKGTIMGNPIESASARFPDFATGQLLVDGVTRGETARFYDFLAQSPMREKLKGLVTRTEGNGPSRVEVHIDMPVKDVVATKVSGRIEPDAATLRVNGLPEPIRDVRGVITFDHDGITAEGLTAQLYELPLRASIKPQGDGSSLLTAAFRLTVDPAGKGASSLIPAWLRKQVSGVCDWKASLPIGGATVAPLLLATDLAGVAVNYPPPLGKTPEALRPLALTVGSDDDAPLHLTVDSPGLFGADLRFTYGREALSLARGALRLGAGAAPVVSEPGLVLGGDVAELDVKAWYDLIAHLNPGGQGQTVRRADLHVGAARWGPYAAREARYQWVAAKDGWTLVASGSGGTGVVNWSSADRGTMSARLDALAVDYVHDAAQEKAEEKPVDPNALPVLDLDAQRFTMGKADLGHVTLATVRTPTGQKTRTFKAEGGLLTVTGEGEWRRRAGQSSGSLSGDFATTDINATLRAFGYTPNLDAKSSRFKAALTWAPAEAGLDWPQAQGTLHLEFQNGQLRAVEPGAGRVLGLVNFYALPRRLALNFKDVLGSGLAFDRITGDFELRDGSAHTQNLTVAGPSVRMDVRGRIGLAARDYDQQVTVYPDVSGSVTLGSLLLGGPVAGALAFIAQQVLNKPLNQVTQLSYRVTGSWDNPQVERGPASETKPPERAPPAQSHK